MARVASLYMMGRGVTKDYDMAVQWSKKAADMGHREGQCALGYLYLNGLGVAKDLQKAIELLKKASDQEDAFAQCHLARAYENGTGVTADVSMAKHWYIQSARNGHRCGQDNCKRLDITWE